MSPSTPPSEEPARLAVIAFSRPLAALAAMREGFFERARLAVAYERTPGSAEQVRGLLAGRWDIAHTAADNVMAYNDREHADLRVVWVGGLGLGQKLIVRQDVRSYQDLAGRTLGVDALDTGYAYVLRRMLQQSGLPSGSYRLQSIGGTAERFGALLEGKIAGALLSRPYDVSALDRGLRLLDPASAFFPNYPGLTVGVRRAWLEDHQELLYHYLDALAEGMRFAMDESHREAMVRHLAEDQGVDLKGARRRYEAEVAVTTEVLPDLGGVRAALDVVRRLRTEMSGIDGPLADSFDDGYYQRGLA